MLTITVYDDYAKNPPGMAVEGRATWTPGKALERFLQTEANAAQRIADALAGGDRETANRAAHTLKGLSASLGANQLGSARLE